MKEWYINVYKALILASAIAFIIGFFTVSKVSLGAYISGYSVLILGVLMILVILFSNVLKFTSNSSTIQLLYSIFNIAGPFILMLGVISFVLYLLITYYDNIVKGRIASSYNTFSSIIVMLLFIQIYMIYKNIDNDKFQTTGKISRVATSIIYLIGLLSAISSIILYIVLKYYSTDGFQNIN